MGSVLRTNDCFIIIPAKPFNEAKSRLGAVLSPAQRAALSRHLLQQTVQIACQVGEVVVISRSAAARRVGKQNGAWALVEGTPTLNGALDQAARWVKARGGQAVLILPSDLPYLEAAALRQLIDYNAASTSRVTIAPCHRGEGTNALFMRPIGLISPLFGQASFAKHQQAAQAVGLTPQIFHHPTIAFDLDIPSDWATLAANPSHSSIRAEPPVAVR